VNPFVEQAFEHETFFTRLHTFRDHLRRVRRRAWRHRHRPRDADDLAAPAGADVDDVPLILVGKMWKGLVEWAKTAMLDPRLALAKPEDLQIPRCLDTADEAIAVVGELHAKWKARP
jgi:hypothetical protein